MQKGLILNRRGIANLCGGFYVKLLFVKQNMLPLYGKNILNNMLRGLLRDEFDRLVQAVLHVENGFSIHLSIDCPDSELLKVLAQLKVVGNFKPMSFM